MILLEKCVMKLSCKREIKLLTGVRKILKIVPIKKEVVVDFLFWAKLYNLLLFRLRVAHR